MGLAMFSVEGGEAGDHRQRVADLHVIDGWPGRVHGRFWCC